MRPWPSGSCWWRPSRRPPATAQSTTCRCSPTAQCSTPSCPYASAARSTPAERARQSIEVKDCGQPSFRQVAGTTTGQGGEWALEYRPGSRRRCAPRGWGRGARRSRSSKGRRCHSQALRRTFRSAVWAKVPFWHKRVIVQRRSGGAWKTLREVLLTDQQGTGADGGILSSATFHLRVPRGTLVRAVVPISQARPCYLAGVSVPQRG